MADIPDPLLTYLGILPQAPEQAVLRLLVELGVQFVGGDEGSLLVLDEAAGELVFAITAGNTASARQLAGQRVPLGAGLTGLAAATREVQIGAPTYTLVQQAAEHAATDSGPQSVLAAPMLAADHVVGVVTAVTFAPGRHFDRSHAQLYGRVATIAGLVVQQRRRIEALEAAAGHTNAAALPPERRVADAVAAVARRGPEAMAHLADLLAAVEALGGRDRG